MNLNEITQINQGSLAAMLDDLHHGITERVMSSNDIRTQNEVATSLLTEQFRVYRPEDLDCLIRISNILYNNTDIDDDALPLDHGVYDLLMELYKKTFPNYQVGADQCNHIAMKHPLVTFEQEVEEHPLVTVDKELGDRLERGFFLDDLIHPDFQMSWYDFEQTDHAGNTIRERISKRKHDTEHNHPELIGTLDKFKFVTCKEAEDKGMLNDSNVEIFERDFFGKHIQEGIIDPHRVYNMVCELKYDGISVEGDCTNIVESARTRGDTGIGKANDITPILQGYRFPHVRIDIDPCGIKFEAIMQRGDLAEFNRLRNYNYKNGRTAIVGLMSNSDAYRYRDLITLVPIQVEERIFKGEALGGNRIAELEFLNEFFSTHGCPNRYVAISGNYIELLYQIKMFLQEAEYARPYVPFMYDGIVVSYIDDEVKERLGRVNFVNKYSAAIKFDPMKKQTIFRSYKYTVGQDGSITPMIYYDPVEFYGTIHPKSSGHSYKRFHELDLAVGDIIDVTYNNDVMPYVSKPYNDNNQRNPNPKEKFPTHCPVCNTELKISNSGSSVICPNKACAGRASARTVNMFSKLNLYGFGPVTVEQIGSDHIKEICELIMNDKLPEYGFGNGESANLKAEIIKLFNDPIYDYDLFGAIGFNMIGSKSWKLIFNKISMDAFIQLARTYNLQGLLDIKGIGPVTVSTILTEYQFFEDDIDYCLSHCNVVRSFGMKTGKQIRFTGFRNRELSSKLRDMGHDADDNAGVTKVTDILLVPFEGHTSPKTVKASENGTQIVPVNQFVENMDKYL